MMCELCNGTHVVHSSESFYTKISTCPDCGPVPDEEWKAKMQAFRKRIDEAKEKMNK